MNEVLDTVVVPVAGLGTRMLPITKSIPKEMLPIIDKPVIQYVVEEIESAGFKKIIFITHPDKKIIGEHFKESKKLEEALAKSLKKSHLKTIQEISKKNLDFIYVNQTQPLGLGHAIKCAEPYLKKKPFAVVLPDRVIDTFACNLKKDNLSKIKKIYTKTKQRILILSEVNKKDVTKYGIAKISRNRNFDDIYSLEKIVEKPSLNKAPSNLAVVGRYIFTHEIFDLIPSINHKKVKGEIELTDAIKKMINEHEILAIKAEGKYFDCGDKIGYLESILSFAKKNPLFSKDFKQILQNLR